MGYKYLRGCSMLFRLCPAQQAQELSGSPGGQFDPRKVWGCMHWSCMSQQLHIQVLELFLLFVLGCVNWLTLALGTGTSVNFSFPFYPIQCPRTTVSLVWVFLLICRWKEHAVKQIPGQRHNVRNVKGPVCTVPHCLDGCGLSWLLLKVNAHLLLLRGTSSSPGFHPYGRAILLPGDRWKMWIP